jgi:glycosyltransferase involved in cell wall biosynthesis
MPTLCLCMIVKNESKIIERCLNSIKDYLDYWIICDTGSSDNTKDIIKQYFNKHQIQGELHEDEWVNFGFNRTLCVQRAHKKADFLLLLDADFIVNIKNNDFKQILSDNYLLKYEGNLNYRQLLLVEGNHKWKYLGVTHEYISREDNSSHYKKIFDDISITHFTDGNNRLDKFERDIKLLTEDLENNPNNERTLFYLANSYFDILDYTNAIKYYKKRIELNGWEEEIYYCKYRLALCLFNQNKDMDIALPYFIDAFNYRPQRLEALYKVVQFYRISQPYKGYAYGMLAYPYLNKYPKDILFVDNQIHKYKFYDELSLCAYAVENYILAKKLNNFILNHQKDKDYDFDRIKENNNWCNKQLLKLVFNI